MNIQEALGAVIAGRDLSAEQMTAVMRQIMTGGATDAQIGGFLIAMRMKGESVEEISAAAAVMRELASGVQVNVEHLVDTCGTGGDGASLFNVSTAAAFVVAAAGGHVAKHGNRSVSSSTGSADVLEAAGVELGLTAQQVARAVESLGIGFMFAPAHHGAMKYAIGPRRELGQRTLFNLLGPLTNPAGVKRQVLGLFDAQWCRPMAEVLKNLGSEHVMVVHAEDGLDEISLAAPTRVAELKAGVITEYVITPESVGIATQSLDGLIVKDAKASLDLIEGALTGSDLPAAVKAADIIALNAGAALYVSGIAVDYEEGVKIAQDVIASGMAREKIRDLAAFTRCQKAAEE